MMTETLQILSSEPPAPFSFGTRLQSAREALGLESKDVAAQLRLNEKIILMMEKDCYPPDLPTIFIHGYLRSYGKLLQIAEHDIKHAIDSIQPTFTPLTTTSISKDSASLINHYYFTRLFTYLMLFTLAGLAGMWWHTQSIATLPSVIVKADATAISVHHGVRLAEAKPDDDETNADSNETTSSNID